MTLDLKNRQTFILSPLSPRKARFSSFHGKLVSSIKEIKDSLSLATKESLWVSYDTGLTNELLRRVAWPTPSLGEAVFTHKVTLNVLAAIENCFTRISFADHWLPPEELGEVLRSENAEDLFIGGSVDPYTETITLLRGGGKRRSITLPFSAFEPSGSGVEPDFKVFAVIDYGQTIRLGEYEAASDAILYEFDPEYRRRIRKERNESEQSFGASLRRLRIQKGLKREDFLPTSAKTIARIEQGHVIRIQRGTLANIASRLGVSPNEIKTF